MPSARPGLAALALDAGALGPGAGDDVFARQVTALGRAGDALVALSAAGPARRVVAACAAARRRGLPAVAGLGGEGGAGALGRLAEVTLVVPSAHPARVEAVHAPLLGLLVEVLAARLRAGRLGPCRRRAARAAGLAPARPWAATGGATPGRRMTPLAGRVALVTGGGRGLGAARCRVLTEAGVRVVAADVRADLAARVAAELAAAGSAGRALALDVSDAASVAAGVDDVLAVEGRLDARLPDHGRAGGGQVVNVVSTAVERAWGDATAYHASKWGLRGLSHTLLVEGRRHRIKVTAMITGGMRAGTRPKGSRRWPAPSRAGAGSCCSPGPRRTGTWRWRSRAAWAAGSGRSWAAWTATSSPRGSRTNPC